MGVAVGEGVNVESDDLTGATAQKHGAAARQGQAGGQGVDAADDDQALGAA